MKYYDIALCLGCFSTAYALYVCELVVLLMLTSVVERAKLPEFGFGLKFSPTNPKCRMVRARQKA
jgi:hypothetical protein